MSEPNVTGIVELADPENHTIEPKITTLSYIQPELWQLKISPIETIKSNFIMKCDKRTQNIESSVRNNVIFFEFSAKFNKI